MVWPGGRCSSKGQDCQLEDLSIFFKRRQRRPIFCKTVSDFCWEKRKTTTRQGCQGKRNFLPGYFLRLIAFSTALTDIFPEAAPVLFQQAHGLPLSRTNVTPPSPGVGEIAKAPVRRNPQAPPG